MLLKLPSSALQMLLISHLTVILPSVTARAVPVLPENTRPATVEDDSPHQDAVPNTIITQQKEQVLEELLRAVGLDNNTLEQPSGRPEPPPFMLNLYSSVADPASGRMKIPRPFNANTVRSLPDKAGGKHRLHFLFNLSHVPATEMLLQAEIHLFKLKPKTRPVVIGKRQPFYQIQLYQLANEDPSSLEGAKLIGLRLVATVGTEWEVFSITDAVSNWLADERTNFGVLVTVSSLTGEPMDDDFIRFAQQGKHHPNKHPFLVLYTSDIRQNSAQSGHGAAKSAYEAFFETYGNLNSPPFMDSTQADPTPNVNTNRYTSDVTTTAEETKSGQHAASTRHRRENRQDPSQSPTEESGTAAVTRKKPSKGTCGRTSMYVDFHEIGWSDWIIYPIGYDAYECQGQCPFPLGQAVQPSNHATVQSLMHLISADVNAPCCVPSQLDPIAVLFFDNDGNVVLKQFDNMVATACGCR